VDSAEVDLKAKTVTVTMKQGTLDRKAVAKALEGTKFEVSSFEQVKDAPEKKKAAPETKKDAPETKKAAKKN